MRFATVVVARGACSPGGTTQSDAGRAGILPALPRRDGERQPGSGEFPLRGPAFAGLFTLVALAGIVGVAHAQQQQSEPATIQAVIEHAQGKKSEHAPVRPEQANGSRPGRTGC